MKKTEVLYSWHFSTEKNRWKFWYTIALALVIWIVIWGFFMKQYWLSFVVMIIAWIYLFIENNSDWNVEVKISDLWIFVNNSFYEFTKMAWYSIIYEWAEPIFLRLYLKTWIKILDLDVDLSVAKELKNILGNYLEENENWELTFWDKIIRMLKL
jgi:hypothetical protein